MITHARTGRVLVAAGAIFAPTSLLAQTVVADAGFDSQAASVAQYCYNSGCPTGPWSPSNLAGFIRQGNADWPAPVPVSPSDVAFVQSDQGSVQQTVTVPTSGSYVVIYWLASRQDLGPYNGNQTVKVSLAGQVVAQTSLSSGQVFHRYLSAPVSLSAGTSYVLLLSGMAAGDSTAFIDNVSIVPATSTTSYSYDALGRLTGVSSTGGANAGYTYDMAGNRTRVTVSGANQ